MVFDSETYNLQNIALAGEATLPEPAQFIPDSAPFEGGRLSERTVCLRADNPSPMTYTGTNTWIVGEPKSSAVYIIDPGPLGQHQENIARYCAENHKRIAAILLTHDHHDHCEGVEQLLELLAAQRLSGLSDAQPISLLQWRDGSLQAACQNTDKASFPIEGVSTLQTSTDAPHLQVIHTPGHSEDSVAFYYEADSLLFTGDVVFKHGPTVVYYPDGNLAHYMKSLDMLDEWASAHSVVAMCPAHGWPFANTQYVVNASRNHRIERLQQITNALDQGVEPDAQALVDYVYTDTSENLKPFALRSVQAQLRYLAHSDNHTILDM